MKTCPFFYSEYTMKIGQNFLDIQYINLSIWTLKELHPIFIMKYITVYFRRTIKKIFGKSIKVFQKRVI